MTSTDTLFPNGCPSCGAYIDDAASIRTPPTPAAEEREAVARAIKGVLFRIWGALYGDAASRLADAALSALAPYRAAEILAAEARGHADADREIASWLYDGDICECCGCMSIAAREVERGKHRKAGK